MSDDRIVPCTEMAAVGTFKKVKCMDQRIVRTKIRGRCGKVAVTDVAVSRSLIVFWKSEAIVSRETVVLTRWATNNLVHYQLDVNRDKLKTLANLEYGLLLHAAVTNVNDIKLIVHHSRTYTVLY